jgi:hypothetical protein
MNFGASSARPGGFPRAKYHFETVKKMRHWWPNLRKDSSELR